MDKMKRARDKHGVFKQKSRSKRITKTVRVSNEIWEKFGNLAQSQNMTRADLLEIWILSHATHGDKASKIMDLDNQVTHGLIGKAIEILSEGLTLKANAGGRIKVKIREAISTLKREE